VGAEYMAYKIKIQSESEALREFKEIYEDEFPELIWAEDMDEEQAILIASKEGKIVAYS
tara:strand:- start:5063 stop:5239 length:177 start_codon:yes stop_codon:yes gene_type:complete